LTFRSLALFLLAVCSLFAGLAGQSVPSSSPLTLLTKEGRRPIQVTVVGDQEFVALDELAAIFQLTVREDSLGAITVSFKGKTIVLTPDQALASISGRLVSLPAAPLDDARGRAGRGGHHWLVPVEFISRALALVYDARLDLRKASRLLIAGDLRVPRVTIRYEPFGTAGRLTIDATPRAGSTVSQENDKLSIKFDADALDVVVPQIQAQGLVQGVHVIEPVSLAVDLGPRFAAFRASTQPLDASSRLTIDLVATQTEATPSPTPSPAPPPDLSAVSQPAPAIRTMAIDPGHGGEDDGAKGRGGTKEKDLTLAVARRLKAALENRLGIRVLLTRDEDKNIPLDDRAALANNNKADVLVSLHANASLRPGTSGASIFVAAFDKTAEDQARASLGTERLPTFAGGVRDVELLVWDLAQIRHVDQSAELARIIEQQFRDRVPLSPHVIDRAPLRVLESANMPAVLVEMGYLTNAEQEKQLTGNEFQNTLVQALVEAALRFRDYLDAQHGSTHP
jgi:N-acetylmuramoyl-L-alanine amidase